MKDDRYNNIGNYIFDKYIFRFGIYFIVFCLLIILWLNNFNLNYVICKVNNTDDTNDIIKLNLTQSNNEFIKDYGIQKDPNFKNGMCKNPAYKKLTWENQEYLMPGVYGKEKLIYSKYFIYILIITLILMFFINHFIYNVGNKK